MTNHRPLNALEGLFASCDVRFAVLLVMESSASVDLESSAKVASESCRLGHNELVKNIDGNWVLVEADDVLSIPVVLEEENDFSVSNFGKFLDNAVQKRTKSAEGPITVQVWPSEGMLLVNGNHGLMDGRSLLYWIGVATGVIKPSSLWNEKTFPDWKDLVEKASQSKEIEPPFVPGNHNKTLTIQDLGKENTSTGKESFRWELPGDIVAKLRTALKAKGATFTGLLVAIFMHAIAIEYDSDEQCDVGVSTLVDLRPLLDISSEDQLPQAHGTVTLLESTENLKGVGNDEIFSLSAALTTQLRDRVTRGEAHRAALAATKGQFDQAGPPATMELSNLGVCLLPGGAKLYTAQRFDGYDGVSCMVHSEANEGGFMRWNASIGQGLDAVLIERIFKTAYNLCLDIAG